MTRGRRNAVVLLMILQAAPGKAAERTMALEVVMNGRPTGQIGEFIDRDGKLYATPADLRDLGFQVPPDITGTEPVALSRLRNVHTHLNETTQTLEVVAANTALIPNHVGGGPTMHLAPLSPAGLGVVFNYDVLGTFTGGENTGGALLDAHIYSPYGVLATSGLASFTPYTGQKTIARLDSSYSYSDPDALRTWRAGDVISGALAWSRAVRLGGGQVSSDFALRPDLVTYPLPFISSSTAVPSTVNVVVNGIREFSQPVQPGPFTVQTLPVVTGAGQVEVAVQDALGRQTMISLPFYASASLLKPGLASYSMEVGAARQDYGLVTDRYAGWAVNGSARYGLNDWLTVSGHGESTDGLVLLGAGADVQIGNLGVLSLAASASSGRAGLPASSGSGSQAAASSGSGSGSQVAAAFQRISSDFSLTLSGTFATNGYRDIAAANYSPMPTASLNASVGYQLGDWGNVGLAYIRQVTGSLPFGPLDAQAFPAGALAGDLLLGDSQVELANVSYSIPLAGRIALYANGFKDLRSARTYGIGVGISMSLGGATSASVGSTMDSGRASYVAGVAKSALQENDYGYRLQDQEGAQAQRSAQGDYLARWGDVSAGVDQSSGLTAGRAGLRGSLVLADRSLFASDQIADSFAVVNTGGVAGVPVLYENRPLGVTDSGGQLLVPSLLSYQNNRLAVDTAALPPDIDVGQTSAIVRPPDRSGIVVNFQVRKVRAALLKLQDANGKFIPLGSVAKVAGALDQPVGYDGEAYVLGLKASNRVRVELPNGSSCMVQFAYKPVPGDIPVIGPLICR